MRRFRFPPRNPRYNTGVRNVVAGTAIAAAIGALAGTAAAKPSESEKPPGAPGAISWSSCPDSDPVEEDRLKGLECGSLTVPLDYAHPDGEKITLALSRARHTAKKFQGVVLLNRGGPGAHGRDMPGIFQAGLPEKVFASYDWIGFDPRGVGASKPALTCDESYQNPGHPRADTVPASAKAELEWQVRAQAFANDCARKYPTVLPHMGSADWAHDLDAIRSALGQQKINYFGYSYGTYLGAVYATMYPGKVRRMVLDSVVRPSGVWYDANLDQDVAFEKRIRAYYAWMAKNDRVYGLGRTATAVAAGYAKARTALSAKPIDGGKMGGSELDDLFLADGYGDYGWPAHARALSAYVVKHDPKPLARVWKPPTWLDQNNYAVYNAVQCRDADWPRNWAVWHRDNWRLYRAGNRFETWSNAWYNAPCAYWGVPGGPPPAVHGAKGGPRIMLIQGTEDAATPYPGALETHRLFPGSSLVVQTGGGNHGVAMNGDECVDGTVAAYFRNGSMPPAKPGPDATCPVGPPPGAERRAQRLSNPGEPVAAVARRTS